MDRAQILADINAAANELEMLRSSVSAFRTDPSASTSSHKIWEIKNSLGMVVVKIYTGLEAILTRISKETDGPLPDSSSFHKKLLTRACAEIPGVRGPIIDKELHDLLAHLLGFRHLCLKRYAVEIDLERGLQNYERIEVALPEFEKQIVAFVDSYQASAADATPSSVNVPKG